MKLVRTSFWLIVTITLISILLDLQVWRQVFLKGEQGPAYYQTVSQIGRFVRTLLILMFVPAFFTYKTDRQSGQLLSFAFLLAVIADFFLILQQQLITGIAIFALMQIVLCARHLKGFRLSFLKKKKYLMSAVIAISLWLTVILLLKAPLQKAGLFYPVAGYGLLLIISLWASWSAIHLETMYYKAAKLAFLGMICFVLCDVTVGLGAIWKDTSEGTLIRAITGLFYTPCLLLLAYSGIKNKPRSVRAGSNST